jgi:hypothetical protein
VRYVREDYRRHQGHRGEIGFEQPVRELYDLSQFPVRYISGEVAYAS